ncbi:ABC transporter ATP-binding protein [Mycolicibacterium komossense]|uniref:ABC transporter ATP-binding protein n=1 Tax=Mycolicibacterium komossense TaxID=1779 RepID=A0ABT3CKS1_9MYCO|nr:ABC transporter ATP-binding protein [Mycolicibacterium komossense]MCV7230065.1 ABC transporter ATP-binding protein [Mycolicibacterium komossense]
MKSAVNMVSGARPDAQPEPPVRTVGSDVVVRNLSVSYGDHHAVRDVSFEIKAGTTLALVGESGSGKSTIALAVSRLLTTDATIDSGTADIGGVDVLGLTGQALREMRGHAVAYLAQDALAALNPVVRIGRQVSEIYAVRGGDKRSVAREKTIAALEQVNIHNPGRVAEMYPYQLSGGMRQRVMIAMALAFEPALLIADEPTTALDVTVQAEILALIVDLQERNGLTCLWITHDMSVVAEMADSVAVLYGGQMLEMSDVYSVFDTPRNPYTGRLLECFRSGRSAGLKDPFSSIPGSPSSRAPRVGCPFSPRCDGADEQCRTEAPHSLEMTPAHWTACHHPLEIGAGR